MITTYKILNGFDRVDSSTWFKQNQTIRTWLNADPANLEPSFSRTEIRRNFFSIRVPDVWNKRPAHVKSSTSINMFKSRYDEWWLSMHKNFWCYLLHLGTKRNWINKISILGDFNGEVKLVQETFLAINFVITLSAKYWSS